MRPYWWRLSGDPTDPISGPEYLLEIPVTTMPIARLPIHVSYLLFLRQFSRAAAWAYWRAAMTLCRLTGVGPSLLLHPLDFLTLEDEPGLAFFPAMRIEPKEKIAFVRDVLTDFARRFQVVPMGEHAAALLRQGNLPVQQSGSTPKSSPAAIAEEVLPG